MLRYTLILAAMLPLTSCAPPEPTPSTPMQDIRDIVAVEQVAFKLVSDTSAYHATGTISAVCLSLGQERPPVKGIQVPMGGYVDPPQSLIESLKSFPIPIVKGSGCWADPTKSGAIVDSTEHPKRVAMAIIMSEPVKVKEGLYKFLLERAFDVETARGFRCTAARKGTEWEVVKCADGWIVD